MIYSFSVIHKLYNRYRDLVFRPKNSNFVDNLVVVVALMTTLVAKYVFCTDVKCFAHPARSTALRGR